MRSNAEPLSIAIRGRVGFRATWLETVVDPPIRRGIGVVAFTAVLALATLLALWWSIPLVVRTVHLFPRSDFKLNLLRVVSSVSMVLGTILFGISCKSRWQSQWRLLAITLSLGTVFIAVGTVIMQVYCL